MGNVRHIDRDMKDGEQYHTSITKKICNALILIFGEKE